MFRSDVGSRDIRTALERDSTCSGYSAEDFRAPLISASRGKLPATLFLSGYALYGRQPQRPRSRDSLKTQVVKRPVNWRTLLASPSLVAQLKWFGGVGWQDVSDEWHLLSPLLSLPELQGAS